MSETVPDGFKDLFEKTAFASFATLMPDGSPQVTPVWFDYDGKDFLVNTAKGRQKEKNVRHDARVSLAIADPQNPYRYLEIRGKVIEITENGAAAHIDKMAKKYLNKDKYPFAKAGEVRLLVKIAPEHFSHMG